MPEIKKDVTVVTLVALLRDKWRSHIIIHRQSLQWRDNGPHGVSNHQPYHWLLKRLFRRRSKKTSRLRVTGLCEGNSPVTGEFPAQRPVTRKMFSFDDVIMIFVMLLFGIHTQGSYPETHLPENVGNVNPCGPWIPGIRDRNKWKVRKTLLFWFAFLWLQRFHHQFQRTRMNYLPIFIYEYSCKI